MHLFFSCAFESVLWNTTFATALPCAFGFLNLCFEVQCPIIVPSRDITFGPQSGLFCSEPMLMLLIAAAAARFHGFAVGMVAIDRSSETPSPACEMCTNVLFGTGVVRVQHFVCWCPCYSRLPYRHHEFCAADSAVEPCLETAIFLSLGLPGLFGG